MNPLYVHRYPMYTLSKYNGAILTPDRRLSGVENLTSEVVAKVVTHSIFYPIQTFQIFSHLHSEEVDGVVDKFKNMVKDYGILYLYRGSVGIAAMQIVQSICSFTFRTIAYKSGNKFLDTLSLFHTILPFDAILYPLQVVRTRMIAFPTKYSDSLKALQSIFQEEGFPGLFKGIEFSSLEIFSSLLSNFVAFEVASGLCNIFFQSNPTYFNTLENISFATITLFAAEAIRYPFSKAKTIVQSSKSHESVMKTLFSIGERFGLMGLYKGFSATLLKV